MANLTKLHYQKEQKETRVLPENTPHELPVEDGQNVFNAIAFSLLGLIFMGVWILLSLINNQLFLEEVLVSCVILSCILIIRSIETVR